MKKILLGLIILIMTGCAGFQFKIYKMEDDIMPYTPVKKVLASENGVYAQRYGVRMFSDDKGDVVRIGLYKIIIGENLKRLDKIQWLSRSKGFAGTLIYPAKATDDWKITTFRHQNYRGEPYEDRKVSEITVKKENLPNPLNIMPNYLFNLIEFVVMYENKEYGNFKTIYILPETSLDDVGRVFGFVVKYKEN